MLNIKLKLRGNFDHNKIEYFFEYLKKIYPNQNLTIHWSGVFIKNTTKDNAACVSIKKDNKVLFSFRGSQQHDTGWLKLSEIKEHEEDIFSTLLNLKLIEAPRKLIWSLSLCFLFVFALAFILINGTHLALAQKYISDDFIGGYILSIASMIFAGLYILRNTFASHKRIKFGNILTITGFILLFPISFLIYPLYSFLLERLSYNKALKYNELKNQNSYSCSCEVNIQ